MRIYSNGDGSLGGEGRRRGSNDGESGGVGRKFSEAALWLLRTERSSAKEHVEGQSRSP